MNKINIGLIGFGTVGSGTAEFLHAKKTYIKNKYHTEFVLKTVCDLYITPDKVKKFGKVKITKKYQDILDDPEIDVVVELIGGLHPAKEIVFGALSNGKDVVTANKALISHHGKELFTLAQENGLRLFFESAVMAGVPTIKTVTEGIVGNEFNGIYGILNGTCNYILTQMTDNNCSFQDALKKAQEKGYAEADPTLDISGGDTAHKLLIMAYLAFGKFIKFGEIYTEGISHISQNDIEYAESLGLAIKLLAIAKKVNGTIEARVHPTLIPKEHPLASINSVFNAMLLDSDMLGKVLLSGEGAGKMAAASGVVSDLINLVHNPSQPILANLTYEDKSLSIKKIDDVVSKFYLRLLAVDKPGVLSKITGVLGKHGISINSVTQKEQNNKAPVPVIMLTDHTIEKNMRNALKEIEKMAVIKSKPVAIRMETLQ
ncbi:MAG: homoserine dehydrogenase [Candidatus Omnitrophica bacterium]|nr:homoserine dehydrogenase [Candidatus Omnitrophota bacterium]